MVTISVQFYKLLLKNLSVVASYLILCAHVPNDLSCIEGTVALLIPEVRNFVECSQAYWDQIDAYLYRDISHGVII